MWHQCTNQTNMISISQNVFANCPKRTFPEHEKFKIKQQLLQMIQYFMVPLDYSGRSLFTVNEKHYMSRKDGH